MCTQTDYTMFKSWKMHSSQLRVREHWARLRYMICIHFGKSSLYGLYGVFGWWSNDPFIQFKPNCCNRSSLLYRFSHLIQFFSQCDNFDIVVVHFFSVFIFINCFVCRACIFSISFFLSFSRIYSFTFSMIVICFVQWQ